jgi:hypothetical protein
MLTSLRIQEFGCSAEQTALKCLSSRASLELDPAISWLVTVHRLESKHQRLDHKSILHSCSLESN